MTNESDNPERIEREIERDRDALRRRLNDLQGELSLDGLTRRLTDKFRENGSDWPNAASEAARSNPVALALTGVGLAWLIFGRGYDPTPRAMDSHPRRQVDHPKPRRDHGMAGRPGLQDMRQLRGEDQDGQGVDKAGADRI